MNENHSHRLRSWLDVTRDAVSYFTGLKLRLRPLGFGIEITNCCNLRCVMCPIPTLTRKKGFMEPALFRRLIDDTRGYAWAYHLSPLGEPTLHPQLPELLAYAAASGVPTTLVSNLNYRNDAMTSLLLNSGITRLVASIDGITPGTYQTVRPNGDFERVLDNLRALKAERERLRLPRPLIEIRFTVMPQNRAEASRAREFLQPYGDFVTLHPETAWPQPVEARTQSPGGRSGRCSSPWTYAGVLIDGTVVPCCNDFAGAAAFGNIGNSRMEDIFNSDTAWKFRRAYRTTRLCTTCGSAGVQLTAGNLWQEHIVPARAARKLRAHAR